jgi:SAM-dependent methyltransferase
MLYDLVTLKKSLLEAYDNSAIQEEILRLKTKIDNIKNQANVSDAHLEYVNQLADYHTALIDQVKVPEQAFIDKIREIDDKISDVSHQLFAGNYELEERDGGIENIRTYRQLTMPEEVEDIVKQRIGLHTSWQYPALEIGCVEGKWTELLVAADPLYVMDKYQEFLDATDDRFPDGYSRKLRKYQLVDYNFDALPSGQFGFIFSWSHFNYVSLDTITEVLKKVKSLLRPGGVFMFSYNDGDTPDGAGMAENFAQSYIPQSILVPTCLALGYEVTRSFSERQNISWLEIKQPGTLSTVKAHPVLGKAERRTY